MAWSVEFNEDFKKEYDQLDAKVKEELVALALTLGEVGPQLQRSKAILHQAYQHCGYTI